MTTLARARYGGYRFPAEIIGHAVWLYFRFPLGLRMVEELLAAWHHRQPRNSTTMGAQIWPAVRQSDPSAPSSSGR
jgi:transposase-like protein